MESTAFQMPGRLTNGGSRKTFFRPYFFNTLNDKALTTGPKSLYTPL